MNMLIFSAIATKPLMKFWNNTTSYISNQKHVCIALTIHCVQKQKVC